MITPALTQVIIYWLALGLFVYDLLAIRYGEPGASISEVMAKWGSDYPFIQAAALGLLCHFWWPAR